MEEIIKKIKKHLEELNNKKFINNLFIILLVSIIVLIGVSFFKEDKTSVVAPINKTVEQANIVIDYTYNLENKLAAILEKLQGVGEVNVMITLEDSVESVPASNTTKTVETTKEVDAEGGTREVNREDLNIQMVSKGDEEIVVLKEVNPTVKGVIVVAEGAGDGEVLERLYEAVKTVLGISGNRVQIYSSK